MYEKNKVYLEDPYTLHRIAVQSIISNESKAQAIYTTITTLLKNWNVMAILTIGIIESAYSRIK